MAGRLTPTKKILLLLYSTRGHELREFYLEENEPF